MKRILVFFGILVTLAILGGCTSQSEVDALKQQNNILQQQIDQQAATQAQNNSVVTPSSYDTNTNSYNTNTPSSYDTNTTTTNYNAPTQDTCCKHCSKGKACGDTCISRSYTCHLGPGCACDG